MQKKNERERKREEGEARVQKKNEKKSNGRSTFSPLFLSRDVNKSSRPSN